MKALVYAGPKKAELREVDQPVPDHGKLLIKNKYCGICGSDIGIYLGTHPRAKAPLIFGHEFMGVLCEDGKRFKKGDRVVPFPLLSCGHCLACRTGNAHICSTLGLIGIDRDGGLSEYSCVDEDVLFKVPDGLSDKAAALIEPLAVIVRAIHQSGFRALDSAAVAGAGPIGMLTGILLKNMGASVVYISDVNPKRLEQAASYGMIPVDVSKQDFVEIVKSGTGGEGVDILFECSGAESAAMQMSDLARIGGTICMVSVHKAPHKVNLRDINFKEQVIIGTRVYTKEEFGQAVNYAAQIQTELEQLATHVVPLRDSEKVFDLIADPESDTIKVLVDCEQS